ncbi:response regulator [Thalassospira marina]|uniref:DNA-binding response regulator n=1 Tax=Thalassospira marina TaxID=2048283 RepID=A0A2N3KRT4_9PROT|nr:response regulator transcription factor [Thalassospira marina]AUG52595.1 DNA-binding response regulator [Thalassospira marina]PKR53289.1 DNA-binding response regulator [Thalassospira marina]
MRLLLIEDEQTLGSALRDHLVSEGYAPDWVENLTDAEVALKSTCYDVILLDINLPDGNGVAMLRALRQRGDVTPCIILTAQDKISDRIAGLNAGADDYLVKPFDLGEMVARLAAVARRYTGNPNPILQIGDVEIDLARKLVFVAGKSVELTGREWALLDQFAHKPGATLSKRQLEDSLYEFGAEIESNTVEVYVSRLRKKIGSDLIRTLRGVGYRLEG